MTKEINDSAYWREFEQNKLTHSAAHYLMAIDSLREELGYARVTDVADKLAVSRGAASTKIADLKKRNWVKEDPNRFLLLADEGEAMVSRVEHNFRILARFFGDVLGISKDNAFTDACKMEHLMSAETGQRLIEVMHFIEGDADRLQAFHAFIESGDLHSEGAEGCPICEGRSLTTTVTDLDEEGQS